MNQNLIAGYAELVAFLTKQGFPITRISLVRWTAKGKGPPVAGRRGATKMYDPNAVLEWAHARTQEEPRRRGRSHTVDVGQTPPSDDDDIVPSF